MQEQKSWLPYVLLVVLAPHFGESSFILMKEGLKVMTSVQMAAYRISVCGLVFFPFVLKHFKRIRTKRPEICFVGRLNGAAVFPHFYLQLHNNISIVHWQVY